MNTWGYQRFLSILLLILLFGMVFVPAQAGLKNPLPGFDHAVYLPAVFRQQAVPINMVRIPAGEFPMGCNGCGISDYGPLHNVYLDEYYIDKYEVTNAEFFECVDDAECSPPGDSTYYANPDYDNHPVVYVNWYHAYDYCNYMNKRLPTEAEWEKAARGTSYRTYPWGEANPSCSLVNSYYDAGCRLGGTTPVGSYPSGASPYGVMDMSGNVFEWVNDWYSGSYYSSSPYNNPTGPDSGTNKVQRGGSFNSNPQLTTYWRAGNTVLPTKMSYTNGFRCVWKP